MRKIYRLEGEKQNTRNLDILVILIYLLLSTIILIFHEPWYDEAQAWQIARCESIYNILFKVPHLEGHPPLWHLILAIFAKNRFPYEITVKAIVTVISGSSIILFIRKSPFCNAIRYTVPFTYFCFYQYRVICRPYAITMLAFCLCAILYKKRNEKPIPFLLVLLILSGTSAYCIVLACVICLFWLAEIVREHRGKLRTYIKDKRIWGLFILFLINLCWVITLIPTAVNQTAPAGWGGFLKRFLYLVFFMPSEVFFTSFTGYNYGIGYDFNNVSAFLSQLGSNLLLLIPLGILFYQNRILIQFVALHIGFCFFAAYAYLTVHHTGIILLYIGYCLWCGSYENAREIRLPKMNLPDLSFSRNLVKKLWFVLVFGVSIFWSGLASYQEITEQYGSGREIAKLISEYNQEEPYVLSEWNEGNPKIISMYAVSALPYLEENPFINVGDGMKNAYRRLLTCTKVEEQEIYTKWRQFDAPTLLVGDGGAFGIYGGEESLVYEPIRQVKCGFIWKGEYYPCDVLLYRKKSV